MKDLHYIFLVAFLILSCNTPDGSLNPNRKTTISETNHAEIPVGNKIIAIVGATLIDGRGGEPLSNSCIVVRNDRIDAVGPKDDIDIPEDAEVIDVQGLTVLPGLIDAHYHNEDSDTLASLYLRNGVTSVRDPGEWIESYEAIRAAGKPIPRLFLAGPHIDTYPPAYPGDSYIVKDAEEAMLAVDRFARQGATVIKVYYGLSIQMIQEVCKTAHGHGLPVTAHLEVTNAIDAINAGLDGIEHITTFGSVLLPMREAEKYKQKVMADNNARRWGRYEVWSTFDFENNPVADSLIVFLSKKQTFISPTLAIFERRADRGDSIEVNGFAGMIEFVGKANQGGARFVVGSHSFVPYADMGFAYHREMELLREAGLTSMEVIIAATMNNARFFRIDERLGSIESGKIADLVFVEGDPLKDIKVMRNVKRVMLNGVWVRE